MAQLEEEPDVVCSPDRGSWFGVSAQSNPFSFNRQSSEILLPSRIRFRLTPKSAVAVNCSPIALRFRQERENSPEEVTNGS